jgi:hypothetical protein
MAIKVRRYIVGKDKIMALLFMVLAMAAVAGMTAGAASAAITFLVENVVGQPSVPLSGNETYTEKVLPLPSPGPGNLFQVKSALAGGAQLTIGCEAVEAVKGELLESKKTKVEKLNYSKCKIDTPAACKVKEPIVTSTLTSEMVELTAGKEPMWDVVKSTAAEEKISTITITECAGEGNYVLKGKQGCTLLTPNVLLLLQGCNYPLGVAANLFESLRFGVSTAHMVGLVGWELSGANKGKKWSIDL